MVRGGFGLLEDVTPICAGEGGEINGGFFIGRETL